MNLQNLLFNTAPFAMIPALVIAVMLVGRSNMTIRILCIHIIFSSMVECISTIMWTMRLNNMFLLHLYTVEEFALLSWFYATIITGKKWKLFFQASIFTFSLFAVLNSIFLQPVTGNNSYATGVESLICMVYALICFYKLINSSPTLTKPNLLALLLINSGVLIYFSSSSLFFTLSNYLRKPSLNEVRVTFWAIHAGFSIIYYLLLFFGLCIVKKAKLYTSYLRAH